VWILIRETDSCEKNGIGRKEERIKIEEVKDDEIMTEAPKKALKPVSNESMDESSDEEESAPVAPVAAPKKKGTLKAAIAAKEAEKARRAAAGELTEDESEVDEQEQKRRDKQFELETDLTNAASLLEGTSIRGKAEVVQGVSTLNPKTKEEFQVLSDRLIELIRRHQDKPLYSMFVEMHVKALAAPLKDVDVRKAASGLTTLANEKQKEQRDKASGKKKPKAATKPALSGARSATRVDTNAYSEALDDFADDDFM